MVEGVSHVVELCPSDLQLALEFFNAGSQGITPPTTHDASSSP
jgi:hypothetical protein